MNTPDQSLPLRNITPEEDKNLTLEQRTEKHGDADENFYMDNEKNAIEIQNNIQQEKQVVEKQELDARLEKHGDPDEEFYLANEKFANAPENKFRKGGTGGIGDEPIESIEDYE